MRAIFIIACAGLSFAAGAQAQDAVRACRQVKDDAERLKCYDRLDTSASNAPRGQRESKADAETGWVVNDEKSPLDDSPLVSAALTSGDGKATLLDLFERRHQLLISHFMFDPAWDDGCPSCSAGADEVSDGLLRHLDARDTRLVYVSRAPLDKIESYKARKGWRFPWYSSYVPMTLTISS